MGYDKVLQAANVNHGSSTSWCNHRPLQAQGSVTSTSH
jgi:hypothetical protein